jgi:SAM-dependent methyltransferase
MGLDINSVQFLIAAHKKGIRFDHTVMLGRHSLNVFPRTMTAVLERHGLNAEKFKIAGADIAYAEPFFEALGAKQVDSMDNSDFEGAKLVHDLNLPIPPEWKEKFDVVYDGGTMEHVFNFPVALRNSMELLRPGGHLFMHTCANNLCGHGFYQFSPELFYRALSPENGFEVERMVIHRVGPYGNWHEVSDPNAIRSRVELITFTPMHLLVQAKRTSVKPIFAQSPQQSDYTAMWQAADPTPKNTDAVIVKRPRFAKIARLIHVIKTGLNFYSRQSLGNRRFFRKTPRESR